MTEFILVPLAQGEVQVIHTKRIRYIQCEDSKCRIYVTTEQQSHGEEEVVYSVRGTKFFVEQLEGNRSFFRFHQSLLVHLFYVESYKHAEKLIRMRDGEVLYASKRGGKEFRKRSNN